MKAKINDIGGPIYWASIKQGKFEVYYNGVVSGASRLRGQIVGHYMKEDEYQGKKFRLCLLHTICEDEKTVISVRTDSGYFRTLCNYLASAKAQNRQGAQFIFSPSLQEKEGKKIAAVFLQDAELKNWYKAFHTRDTGTLPQPAQIKINGQTVLDWTPITEFYEQFISSTYGNGWGSDHSTASLIYTPPVLLADENPDDLPF